MYDRAPRNFTFQSSVGTSYNLGPGTYQHSGTISIAPEAYAPFQSLAGRDFTLASDDAALLPSAAHYEVKVQSSKVQGGSSLNNKDSRFKPLKNDIPGPGNYCIEEPIRCISNPLQKIKQQFNNEVKKITYRRGEVPPSIPHAKTAYGYEEGPHGILIRQKPPPMDTTLGPAFYDPKSNDVLNNNKYKGPFWSYDTSKRSDLTINRNPGPSEYQPFNDYWAEVGSKYEKGEKEEGEINRFFDVLQKKAVKEHIPGPNTYYHSGVVNCPRPMYNSEGEKIEHPPFGVQARRFGNLKSDIPGPGSYNDPRSALNTLKKLTGLKRSPFSQTAVRFNQKVDRDIPGPQQYVLDSDLEVKPSYISTTRKGGFGSTSIRNLDPFNKTKFDVPGPAHYQPKDELSSQKFQQPLSSMFASLTNRDYDPITVGKNDQPDGLSYNVIESFQASQGHTHFAEPRTTDAKKRHTSFMTAATRYSKGSPLDASDKNIPGPGAYDHRTYLSSNKGKFYSKDKRFRMKFDATPGPDHYEIPPPGSACGAKCNFNITLGKNCVNQNLLIRRGLLQKS